MKTTKPDCRRCGCPHELHTHLHTRDYCGRCVNCDSYQSPKTTWRDWLFWLRAGLALWRTRG